MPHPYCVVGDACWFDVAGLSFRGGELVLIVVGTRCHRFARKADSSHYGQYFLNPINASRLYISDIVTLNGGVPANVSIERFEAQAMDEGGPQNTLSICWATAPADDTPASYLFRIGTLKQSNIIDPPAGVSVLLETITTDRMNITFTAPIRLEDCIFNRWEVWIQNSSAKLKSDIEVTDADPFRLDQSSAGHGFGVCDTGFMVGGLVHETFYRFKVRVVCDNLPRVDPRLDSSPSDWFETMFF